MNKKLQNRIVNQSRKFYDKNGDTYQHFSFIVDRNKIISFGRSNKKKTHTFSQRQGYEYFRIHSELAAIKDFPDELIFIEEYGLSIINTRLNKKLELINSRPCLQCMKLLDFVGIRDIIYSNEKGEFEKL